MKQTAIYLRVSTSEQSTDSQRDELEKYCQSRGWANPIVFEDTISGAKNTKPGLEALMGVCRAGGIERVVCYKLDRLGRSLTQLALFLEQLVSLKIPLICTSQGIDTSDDSPVGKLQLGVLMAVAEFERTIIRDRVKAGLAAAKAKGRLFGRPFSEARKTQSNRIIEQHKLGLSVRTLAKAYHLAPSTIHNIIKEEAKCPLSESQET